MTMDDIEHKLKNEVIRLLSDKTTKKDDIKCTMILAQIDEARSIASLFGVRDPITMISLDSQAFLARSSGSF